MLNVLLFSIAGKKPNNTIDDILEDFINSSVVPEQDKKILRHSLEVSKNGTYPSKEYYTTFYTVPDFTYKNLAEILKYSKDCLDFYKTQNLQKNIIKSINESNNFNELQNNISVLLNNIELDVIDEIVDYKPQTYIDSLSRPIVKGVSSGISEFESITNGWQPGTIASICAFTGHGKSTFVISCIFKNIRDGKKCILLSIEMAPEIVWLQLQARYLYEVKGLSITSQDLIHHKLDTETEELVKEYDADFRRDICSNLIIIDESYISKAMMLDYKKFSKLIKSFEKILGGVDLLAVDHVGQFELMYEDCGNRIIKQLQSFTKTYVDSNGVKPVTLFAVQTNREGEKRARKRDGVYDIQAISDLNEVERSCSYILFLYSSDDMKIVQECKLTLSKNRLGPVLTEPVTTSFNPAVCIVGSTIEKISMTDEDFSAMDGFNFDDEF